MVSSLALLCPGQGAQYVGMGKDFYDQFTESREVFEQADDLLGFKLSEICFNGPEEDLNKTDFAQPAIFVSSLAVWKKFTADHPEINLAAAAGLSLGEFTALVALKSLSFKDGLEVVRNRGIWMQEAAAQNPGGMCSIIGLTAEKCSEVAVQCGIQVANYNSPEQTVLSGSIEGVLRAEVLAKEMGAKRALALKVSGAFHSDLMTPARERLEELLKKIEIKKPEAIFYPNVSAVPTSDPNAIRANLAAQVTSSVRWVDTMMTIHSSGITHAFEPCPGKVLKGLGRRICPEIEIVSLDRSEDLKNMISGATFS